ncbi:hypothetical protein FM042_04920 [Aliidiomarina halalkaliphila]|uniref:Lysozyme inhibitor LprI N-terminal domain-containing protein n=1 Tax=Aliidiomarina halalkaliphila TaxID=2593535 RepID=A0A552X5E5_9GAMM|nr:hypothetical protein [Aliidiomarina halalkaliphila]TRW50179.1 hypothetical protein FM042_04920 [Aliidiomarina halalkaliphila]
MDVLNKLNRGGVWIAAVCVLAVSALAHTASANEASDRRLVDRCLTDITRYSNALDRNRRMTREYRARVQEYERRGNAYQYLVAQNNRLNQQVSNCNPAVQGVNYCNNLLNQFSNVNARAQNEHRWLQGERRRLIEAERDADARIDNLDRLRAGLNEPCREAWPVADEIWWSVCEDHDVDRRTWDTAMNSDNRYRC